MTRFTMAMPGRWRRAMQWMLAGAGLAAGLLRSPAAAPVEDHRGTNVVVLYNKALPESQSVAQHYANRRGVPTNQIIGLSLPATETISRADFDARLLRPLVAELTGRGLLGVREEMVAATAERPGRVAQVVTGSSFRYLAPCYGVPLRVTEDSTRREPGTASLAEGLRRNEAAVDAELTVLPFLLAGHPLTGPMANPLLGTTNAALMKPANGYLVVSRLDGPTPALAAGLVDRALEAEQNGLLGRGYFDLRGTTDPTFVPGDLWISNACNVARAYGFDVAEDRRAATLPTGFPLSHVALYAGWYAPSACGPFALPQVEFMPGAVAYHLHSFSAMSLRTTNQYWVGPLIARGATATMGTVAEPYLDGTPDLGLAFARLLFSGFTWGEAALASQRLLSWQLCVVGDPLYRPFGLNALDRAKDLAERRLGRVDWSLVTLYNRRRLVGGSLADAIKDLEAEPRVKLSPILQEKLGDFVRESGDLARAAGLYRSAAGPLASPQQRKRLHWSEAEAFTAAGQEKEAYQAYKSLLEDPNPADDPILLYERLVGLAGKLEEEREGRRWAEELARLRAPAPK